MATGHCSLPLLGFKACIVKHRCSLCSVVFLKQRIQDRDEIFVALQATGQLSLATHDALKHQIFTWNGNSLLVNVICPEGMSIFAAHLKTQDFYEKEKNRTEQKTIAEQRHHRTPQRRTTKPSGRREYSKSLRYLQCRVPYTGYYMLYLPAAL